MILILLYKNNITAIDGNKQRYLDAAAYTEYASENYWMVDIFSIRIIKSIIIYSVIGWLLKVNSVNNTKTNLSISY